MNLFKCFGQALGHSKHKRVVKMSKKQANFRNVPLLKRDGLHVWTGYGAKMGCLGLIMTKGDEGRKCLKPWGNI